MNKTLLMKQLNEYIKMDELPLLRLAAKSIAIEETIDEKTFVDKDSRYLIKILKWGAVSKVYIFSKEDIPDTMKIKIEPGSKTFKIDASKQPLIIKEEFNIDTVELVQ